MLVAKTITVRCTNADCPKPASGSVPIPLVAPGVIGMPKLICAGCGCDVQCDVQEVRTDA